MIKTGNLEDHRRFMAGDGRGQKIEMTGPGQAMQVGCSSVGSESALLEIMCQTSSDMKEVERAVENIMGTLFGPALCDDEAKEPCDQPSVRSEAWESYLTTQRTMKLLRIIRDRLTN